MSTATVQNQLVDAGGINLLNLLRNTFAADVPNMLYRHGNPIFRLIKPGTVVYSSGSNADEGGHVFNMRTGFADSARSTLDASADFQTPRRSRADKVRVRFSLTSTSNNDINRLETGSRIHIADMKRAGQNPGVALDIAQNSIRDAVEGIDEAGEILMHASKTAQIGSVNGAPKNNAANTYAGCGSYSSGASVARIVVDEFSIGVFKPNMHLDFYSSGTLQADEVRVTDVNYEDLSLGLELTDRSTVANLDLLTDNDEIYRANESSQGFKGGFGEIFKTDYTGDSWFGGIDRSASDKRHFIPHRTRTAATVKTTMSNKIINTLARSIAHFKGMDTVSDPYVLVMGMEAVDNWREDADNAATNVQSASAKGGLRVGSTGLEVVHPVLGTINVTATRTARNDRAIMFLPSEFELLYGDFPGMEIVSNGNGGVWERVPGNGVNGGGSVYYRYEAMTYMTPFPKNINTMACAFNVE